MGEQDKRQRDGNSSCLSGRYFWLAHASNLQELTIRIRKPPVPEAEAEEVAEAQAAVAKLEVARAGRRMSSWMEVQTHHPMRMTAVVNLR